MVHVSTLGFLPAGHAEAAWPPVAEAGLLARSGYAQSKWVAERLMSAAARRDAAWWPSSALAVSGGGEDSAR